MTNQIYNRKIKLTADGSHTLYVPHWQEHYHSVNGALAESIHVFIKHGFDRILKQKKEFSILEVGFGTGLNALLSLEKAVSNVCNVHYSALEPYPLSTDEVMMLNLPDLVADGIYADAFAMMHSMPFGKNVNLAPGFNFIKNNETLERVVFKNNSFDLVYHDAFAPQFQTYLWDEISFSKLFHAMKPGGVLATYSARGSVKRALRASGFSLLHPAGPSGKREMTVATKPDDL